MGGNAQSPLVADAAMVRLDVYGPSGHCVDGMLAAGAGAPILSRSYAQGQAISLDVPPGPHALVLSTFADADGVQTLGVGCTESTLTAGEQICFDLTISPAPDGGGAPAGDADMATNGGCDPSISNVNNCGGCGNACDQTNSVGATCTNGTCVYTSCRSGWADCNTANSDVDGCETNITDDPANCGACGRACSATNVAAAHCTAGLCDSTCNSGYGNCSQPAAGNTAPYTADDGCESNLTSCVATACCSMTMPTPPNMCAPPSTGSSAHSNGIGSQAAGWGLGQTYADCHALGVPDNAATYTSQMANEAMAAAPGTPQTSAQCGNANCVWKVVASRCVVWCYSNDTTKGGSNVAGHVYQNDAAHSPSGTCSSTGNNASLCPLESDPTWN